ncbi:MAG: hypothetical protein IKW89_02595 [Bacteroidales bacterium]|nr:hypothetical protein [Bacteroidales bacterium]
MSKFSDTIKYFYYHILPHTYPFGSLLYIIIGLLFPSKAKSIAIIGTKWAGKTTLWKGLGGIKEYKPNTQVEPIQSFTITRANGTTVVISHTYDIGGEDDYVCEYEKLIKEDTFIYYLVDANRITLHDYLVRVRSDLVKIDKIVKSKKIPEDKLGFKFIITHYYDYTKSNPFNSEYELYRQFLNGLKGSEGRGVIGKRLTVDNYSKIMMVAELDPQKAAYLKKNYIDIIKNEIGA